MPNPPLDPMRFPASAHTISSIIKHSSLGLFVRWTGLFSLCLACIFPPQSTRLQAQETEFAEEDDCHLPLGSKVEKLIEKGRNGSKYDRAERVQFFKEGFDHEESCMECLYEWGRLEFNEIKRSRGSFRAAEEPLIQLHDLCPFFNADVNYMLGAMAYGDGRYQEAKDWFDDFLGFPKEPEEALGKRYQKHTEEVRGVLPNIDFLLAFWKNKDAYTPSSILPISESSDEYLPGLSPDGSMLFFTRKGLFKAKGDVVSKEIETFMLSERIDGSPFGTGHALDHPFRDELNYGGVSISVDNMDLYIAAQNPVAGFPNNIDLFLAKYQLLDRNDDGTRIYFWGDLMPLTALNSPDGWEAQPALSPDGTELFFSSVNARSITDASGNATMDIWKTTLDSNGTWQEAELLPAPINSATNDKVPVSCTRMAARSTLRAIRSPREAAATISGCASGIPQVAWGDARNSRSTCQHSRRRARARCQRRWNGSSFCESKNRHKGTGHHAISRS
jgi:hypothetical protein